jgi:hypothetical protein
MPDDPNAPDLSQFSDMLGRSQEIPNLPPSPVQQKMAIPTPGGTPNIINLIQQMAHPTAQATPGEAQPRPPSRLSAFEGFLGNFLQSFAAGMGAGSGPDAEGKAFSASMQAPYQNQLQQYGLQQQAQQQQSLEQERQSQAQYRAAQAQAMGEQVTLPNGMVVPKSLAEKMLPAQIAAQSRENVAGVQAGTSKANVTATNASREKVASQNTAAKLGEFQQTQDYLKWKAKLDSDTKLRVGAMQKQATQDKAPAAMFQSATFAKGGMDSFADARKDMETLEKLGVMGSLPANKVEDWIFGKGLVDPNLPPDVRRTIGHLRASINLGSSAMLRAHTGRTSKEIYDDFKSMLGPGQDWSALRGAMDESTSILTNYATAPSDANIAAMRAGQSATPNSAPPPGARVRDYTQVGSKK